MHYTRAVAFGLGLLCAPLVARAQPYTRVTSCSAISDVQASSGGYIDENGLVCTSAVLSGGATFTGDITKFGGNNVVTGTGASGLGIPRVTVSNDSAVLTSTSPVTLSTLDIKTVTTGGTAVKAISAGNRVKGGWLKNPGNATVALCINEIGTASGTTSSGDTTCIDPGQSYTIAPAAGAVSVVTSDSSHPFSGMGFK